MLRVLDLFSGIGGFSLGLERTGGFRTVAFCEIDPYCRAVLRKHWPAVPCFEDVRELHAFDVGPVDVVCGGFPCQDISNLNRQGRGLAGDKSGLWGEYRRIIEECCPSWIVIENASVLRSKGLDQVLWEIAALGYDAEWHCVTASTVGAPHIRDRVWIVAYPNGQRQQTCLQAGDFGTSNPPRKAVESSRPSYGDFGTWNPPEPDVGRVANGVPSRVDRLRALGNAVVPQIPEIIGRAILEAEKGFAR